VMWGISEGNFNVLRDFWYTAAWDLLRLKMARLPLRRARQIAA
jgi:hypothetical protein